MAHVDQPPLVIVLQAEISPAGPLDLMPGCPMSKTGSSQEGISFMVPSSWEGHWGCQVRRRWQRGAQDSGGGGGATQNKHLAQNWEVQDN